MDAAQLKRGGNFTALASYYTHLEVADRPKALDLPLFKLEDVLSVGKKKWNKNGGGHNKARQRA